MNQIAKDEASLFSIIYIMRMNRAGISASARVFPRILLAWSFRCAGKPCRISIPSVMAET